MIARTPRLAALVAGTLCLGWLTITAAEPPAVPSARPSLQVEVRSSVDDLWDGVRKKAPQPHGKLYYITSVAAIDSEKSLVLPVDEPALVAQLKKALAREGFREISETEKPDVLLSVTYGRGFLKNPYLKEAVDEITPGIPTTSVRSSKQAFAQREAGYESKVQNAQREKLFLTVRALKYPEKRGERPTRLWQTTMILDSPDSHDLNQVAIDMLQAGVPHFDRVLPEVGIVVSTDQLKNR